MNYPDDKCPDCCDPIPNDALEGEECKTCGHVWWFTHKGVRDETPTQYALYKIFMGSCGRWSSDLDVKKYLNKFKGKLLVGYEAVKVLCNGVEGHVAFAVVDEHPFSDGNSPVAIVLPEESAFRITVLGGLP